MSNSVKHAHLTHIVGIIPKLLADYTTWKASAALALLTLILSFSLMSSRAKACTSKINPDLNLALFQQC